MNSNQKFGFDGINDEILQSNCKQLIKTKIFLGEFKEKRYNEDLKDYRDLIVIDSQAESEIVQDLEKIQKNLIEYRSYGQRISNKKLFFGFTAAPDDLSLNLSLLGGPCNVCLWTELDSCDNNVLPFGKYWFQVRTIKFKDNEISVRLKVLRSVQDTDHSRTFSEKVKAASKKDGIEPGDEFVAQLKAICRIWKKEFSEGLVLLLASINRQTIKDSLKFFSLLVISLTAGLISSIRYIGVFTIKFMEQLNWFIHVSTPVFLAVIDMFTKIIGEFPYNAFMRTVNYCVLKYIQI
jgi:hypothetical protein